MCKTVGVEECVGLEEMGNCEGEERWEKVGHVVMDSFEASKPLWAGNAADGWAPVLLRNSMRVWFECELLECG